jgi:hypothetical protein
MCYRTPTSQGVSSNWPDNTEHHTTQYVRNTTRNIRAKTKATRLGTAHIVRGHPSSRWFHHQTVALLGLTRLIYLFIGVDLYNSFKDIHKRHVKK